MALLPVDWMNAVFIPIILTLTLGTVMALYTAYVAARWLNFTQQINNAVVEFAAFPVTLRATQNSSDGLVAARMLYHGSRVQLGEGGQPEAAAKLYGLAVEESDLLRKFLTKNGIKPPPHPDEIMGGPWRTLAIAYSTETMDRGSHVFGKVAAIRPNYWAIAGLTVVARFVTKYGHRRRSCPDGDVQKGENSLADKTPESEDSAMNQTAGAVSEQTSSFAALAIAVSAFAAVGLFWAVILVLVLLGQGPALAKTGSAASGAVGGIKITDITSGLTALFALAVASGSLWFTRRHNRLSVRPKISIVRVIENNDGTKKGLYLRNHGLGPALISEITFESKSTEHTYRRVEELSRLLFSHYAFQSGELGIYWLEVLPKDACERLLWLESDQPEVNDDFQALLSDIRLVVKYRSFYGEPDIETFEMVPVNPVRAR